MRQCFRRTYILIRASFLLGSGSGHQSKVADDLLRVLGLSGTRLSAAAPQATQRSTVMSVSVCVCLCLCLRAYLRNQKPDLQNILRFITRLSQGHRIKNKQLKIVTYDVEYEEQTDDSKHAYQNCDAMQRMPCNKKVCRQLPTSLTIWHSLPHLLLRAVLRRGCC